MVDRRYERSSPLGLPWAAEEARFVNERANHNVHQPPLHLVI
jgi:hypothetical protein